MSHFLREVLKRSSKRVSTQVVPVRLRKKNILANQALTWNVLSHCGFLNRLQLKIETLCLFHIGRMAKLVPHVEKTSLPEFLAGIFSLC